MVGSNNNKKKSKSKHKVINVNSSAKFKQIKNNNNNKNVLKNTVTNKNIKTVKTLNKIIHNNSTSCSTEINKTNNNTISSDIAVTSTLAKSSKLSDLQSQFARKLEGGRFRFINEGLYKSKGKESFEEFQEDPSLFNIYHVGYREQAKQWPENPLDKIIRWIKTNHTKAIIADMGCGDAKLAESVNNKVYSFDLVSVKPIVTACDIAHTPLKDNSVDIVVFCLSLMGTNISDFLREAYRILRLQGIVKITEVRSRFEGEQHGISKFIKVIKLAGFDINNSSEKNNNKMFFEIECVKTNRTPTFDESYSARPCLYKKR